MNASPKIIVLVFFVVLLQYSSFSNSEEQQLLRKLERHANYLKYCIDSLKKNIELEKLKHDTELRKRDIAAQLQEKQFYIRTTLITVVLIIIIVLLATAFIITVVLMKRHYRREIERHKQN